MARKHLLMPLLALALLAGACGGGSDPAADDEPAAGTGTTEEAAAGEETEEEGSDWPDKLVLGFVPSREADVLVENVKPLEAALSEALGITVESFVSQDYTGLVEAMASGQADVGAFGPLGLVRAEERAGVEVILQSERFGSLTYHTQYFTNNPDKYCLDEPQADEDGNLHCNGTLDASEGPAGADTLASIEAGTTLAYVDPTSTSGYLIPALQMQEAGVDLASLESVFAGGHDSAVLAVYNGDVEVGMSFDDARGIVAGEHADVGEKVVVFAYSEEIPNDGIAVRGDLPDDLKEAITQAFVDYAATDEGKEVLNSIYEIDNLVPADGSVFDVVRRADEALGDTISD
ncbi:MAG: phosphate/phosphite/phosphonate ABC transporter substrate-binding protein [Nitriliruptorales bacterium]